MCVLVSVPVFVSMSVKYVSVNAVTCVRMHACVRVFPHACEFCVCMLVCSHMCVYVCLCVCMCSHLGVNCVCVHV